MTLPLDSQGLRGDSCRLPVLVEFSLMEFRLFLE